MWASLSCLSSSRVLCVLAGFVVGVLSTSCKWPKINFTRQPPTDWGFGKRNDRLYSLDHGKLNIELPPKSMWMNMGYWRGTDDFPTACQALLIEVLKKAKLLDDTGKSPAPKLRQGLKRLSILDLGFGCGDQTAFLVQLARVPLKYVGITLDYRQYRFAQNRLGPCNNQGDKKDVQIFCEDAARVNTWPDDLHRAVASLNGQEQSNNSHDTDEIWVLALDSLYHFSPSRKPVLSLAAQNLNASVMAFDMLLSSSASFHQRWVLKLIAWMGDCPVHAFMTRERYTEMLAEAGYDRDHIEFHDVTADVFEPLARYMRKRSGDLEDVGLKLGSLNIARLVFDWWARSRVLEAVIVVAREVVSRCRGDEAKWVKEIIICRFGDWC
ncbi:hypothetical protein PG994_006986 [Apiospora phragmitis]|uniref:S-adenosyl-L-methionine-dependent methyltransferase n=1 Tax=Apiospora phragmitis TaxID=2905665 RepID=A0ABR1UZH4_9PEZI